ncbi:MAG: phosphoribosylaminoimidazolesuccinocarboxamide synthase [Candidatus Pacebacteria bacterium]|nr:phosphoribosylaminoimidazolesuccinocarboxamide synthase [Candidatus Paceibacterota bacterium]
MSGEYEFGEVISEGKTKVVRAVKGNKDLVVIKNKDDITAHDDPSFTKQFGTKARSSTETTCRVFELLAKTGLRVAYVEQLSPTEFLAKRCKMIPLEAVARRYAVGSFLKRHPEMENSEIPYRFEKLYCEFFLKTAKGIVSPVEGEPVDLGLNSLKGEEDPLIVDVYSEKWDLFHSKKPAWDKEADLSKEVSSNLVLASSCSEAFIARMEDLLRKTFLVLEGAWANLALRLIDMKIEFGLSPNGRIVIADVIDNDSWRLRTQKWEELSKQVFRDGGDLGLIEENYQFVAGLSAQLRIPEGQVLVLWRGSKKDLFPEFPSKEAINLIRTGLFAFEKVTLSGHKSTRDCLDKLNRLISDYPRGGVIVAKVGRSNGLGPILAAHTTWPVLAIPATLDCFPEDIWSNIRMPSNVPLMTVWPEANAMEAALNILAQQGNPALYAHQQYEMEKRLA